MNNIAKVLNVCTLLTTISFSGYSQNKPSETLIYVDEKWPPIFFENAQSPNGYGHEGLNIDILNEIFAKSLNLPLEIKQIPWKRAQQSIKRGSADLMITVPTEERKKFSIASNEPVLKLYMHAYTYKNHPRLNEIKTIKSADDIRELGLVAVTYLGNGWHKDNIDSHSVKTVYITENEGVIKYLADKRADILIESNISVNYDARLGGLLPKITPTGVKFGPINFHLFMSKKSNHIEKMDDINIVIKTLNRKGVLERLTENYSGPRD